LTDILSCSVYLDHTTLLDLRVALNATCLNDRPSGAKQRFLGLYRALAGRLPDVRFVVFEPVDCRMESWFHDLPNVEIRPTPIPSTGMLKKLLIASRYWHSTLAKESFDVFEGFHLPFYSCPGSKNILTVHDIRSVQSEGFFFSRMVSRFVLRRSIRNADVLVTVSEAMKEQIFPYSHQTPIRVIPNGLHLDADRRQPSAAEKLTFLSKYSLPDHFILAVGHFEPRKNYLNLIKSLSYLHSNDQKHHLMIVGNDGGELGQVRFCIKSLGLAKSVTIASRLTDEELCCAYSLCDLFVFPSIYEGFGIPVLEAMSMGCPMALSNLPVFHEITEGRSTYFSPLDPTDIASGILRALSSNELIKSNVNYGYSRVLDFSYQRIARLYEALYGSHSTA